MDFYDDFVDVKNRTLPPCITLTQVDTEWVVFVQKNANIHETDLVEELKFTEAGACFEKTYKINAKANKEIDYILNQLLFIV